MRAARQSVFNDLNLGNDVTLISFFRLYFELLKIRYDLRNIVNWSFFPFYVGIGSGARLFRIDDH